MKKYSIADKLDLSKLAFLQHGDYTLIANELNKDRAAQGITVKVAPQYVGEVCRGLHENNKILIKAFELAIKREGQFPKQALKVA